jgi:hypothetical protein
MKEIWQTMDSSVNTILVALGSAIATGTQTAISDTVKDGVEALVQRIRQVFSSRHSQQEKRKSLMILDEYRQNPVIWEQPLKEALIKAGLSQDSTTITMAQHLLTLLDSQQGMRDTMNINHYGAGHGSVYGPNYGTVNYMTAEKDKVEEGKEELALGQDALWRSEYDAAKAHLERAKNTLAESQCPHESAQIRFLLTLALLNGKRPRSAAHQIFCQIVQLLQSALSLHSTSSYLYTLALIKRDYAWNGYSHYRDEADGLVDQMEHVASMQQDQDNFNLIVHCQPRLMQDAQSWWS